MNNQERAEKLCYLLKQGHETCCDVDIHLHDTYVSYEDQGGKIEIDFDELTITNSGHISDTFGCDTKEEFGKTYITEKTSYVEFYTSRYGSTHVSLTNQYEDLKSLIDALDEYTLFMDMDLHNVLKDN